MTTDLRCPECSSLVRPEARWCSLCHADLRSEEDKAASRRVPEWELPAEPAGDQTDWAAELAAMAAGPAEPAGTSGDAAGGAAVAAPPRGRHARPGGVASTDDLAVHAGAKPAVTAGAAGGGDSGSASDADQALASAGIDVRGMLELLAANEPAPLGRLSGRLATKGQRAVAVLVAAVTLTAVVLLVMFVLGLFVH